jgi:type II secretion system protein D
MNYLKNCYRYQLGLRICLLPLLIITLCTWPTRYVQAQAEAPPLPNESANESANEPVNLAPANANDLVPMQFPGTPIEVLIQHYKRITGKQIIEGQNLTGPTVTLHTPDRIPRQEAIRLMEAALLLNGIAVVPAGPNTVKILNVAAQNPRSEGLQIYTDLGELPNTEQIVSYFTNLNFIPVNEAVNILQTSIAPNPYTVILPIENNQSLVMTEKTSVIRQLIQLKELIDTPQASMQREFIQLTRADAEKVAEQLQNILDSGSRNQSGSGNRRANSNQAQANNRNTEAPVPGQANSDNAISQLTSETVRLVPDARTNRILVVAPQANFEYLKQLILDFDSAVDFSTPLNRSLRYVKAGDILQVLGEILAEGDEEVNLVDGDSTGGTNNSGGGAGGGGSGGLSRPDRLSETGLESAPQSLTVGKTRIVADRRNNTILIMGTPENINRASAILDNLDTPAQQVFLSTVIGQITLDDTTEFGVDILQKFERSGDFGGASQSVSNPGSPTLLDPTTLITAGAFPTGTAGMALYGTFTDTLDVFVRALKTTNNFKVLSRPTVFTTNNKKAVILSGRREPIPSQSLSSLNTTDNINSSVTTNIDYEDVVLKLEVIPLINSENEITLTIAQQNDSISGTRLIGGNSVPIISTQELVTTVTVKNRNTVILGGLIEDSAQDEVTGVPILSDIPLIGNLFKTTSRSRPRRELVIMVQPEIVARIDDVTPSSNRRVGESFIGQDAADFSEDGGSQRVKLDSMWRMKHRPPAGSTPPKALPVIPETEAPANQQPAEAEPMPVEPTASAPASNNPQAILTPFTTAPAAPLISDRESESSETSQ